MVKPWIIIIAFAPEGIFANFYVGNTTRSNHHIKGYIK